MDNQLIKTTITILSVAGKVTRSNKIMYKIKGSDNKTYQLWQNKADGSESKAFETLKTLKDNGLNSTVEISYKEDQGEYDGKAITYRTIVMLYLSKGNIDHDEKSTSEYLANIKEEISDNKTEEINFSKCKHDYLVEAYRAGKDILFAEEEAEVWAAASARIISNDFHNVA